MHNDDFQKNFDFLFRKLSEEYKPYLDKMKNPYEELLIINKKLQTENIELILESNNYIEDIHSLENDIISFEDQVNVLIQEIDNKEKEKYEIITEKIELQRKTKDFKKYLNKLKVNLNETRSKFKSASIKKGLRERDYSLTYNCLTEVYNYTISTRCRSIETLSRNIRKMCEEYLEICPHCNKAKNPDGDCDC